MESSEPLLERSISETPCTPTCVRDTRMWLEKIKGKKGKGRSADGQRGWGRLKSSPPVLLWFSVMTNHIKFSPLWSKVCNEETDWAWWEINGTVHWVCFRNMPCIGSCYSDIFVPETPFPPGSPCDSATPLLLYLFFPQESWASLSLLLPASQRGQTDGLGVRMSMRGCLFHPISEGEARGHIENWATHRQDTFSKGTKSFGYWECYLHAQLTGMICCICSYAGLECFPQMCVCLSIHIIVGPLWFPSGEKKKSIHRSGRRQEGWVSRLLICIFRDLNPSLEINSYWQSLAPNILKAWWELNLIKIAFEKKHLIFLTPLFIFFLSFILLFDFGTKLLKSASSSWWNYAAFSLLI